MSRVLLRSALLAGLIGFLPLAVTSSQALAQQPSEADTGDAARFFREGKAHYAKKRFAESYASYKKAWSLQKGYDIAGNLGNVEIQVGRYRDAVEHLQFALDNLPPSIPKREAIIAKTRTLLAKAKSHIAMVTVATEPEGAEVSVDGTVVGTTPLSTPLALEPGAHQVSVALQGYSSTEQQLTAQAGSAETLRLTLVPQVDSPASDNGPSVPVMAIGGSIAVAAAGTGAVFLGLMAAQASDNNALRDKLDDTSACAGTPPPADIAADCETLTDGDADESTYAVVGGVLLGTGAAVGIATLIYALLPRDGDAEASASALPIIVTPIASQGFSGIGVSGRF